MMHLISTDKTAANTHTPNMHTRQCKRKAAAHKQQKPVYLYYSPPHHRLPSTTGSCKYSAFVCLPACLPAGNAALQTVII